jgi:hypothetical protein
LSHNPDSHGRDAGHTRAAKGTGHPKTFMVPDLSFDQSTSIVYFNSVPDLRRYLKHVLDGNLREMDKMSDAMAMAMRDNRYDAEHPSIKGWVKKGNLFVNRDDPDRATLDLLFHLSREIKPRIAQISEAMKAVEKLDSLGIGDEASMILYVRQGIPERIIVVGTEAPSQKERFELKATYRTK